MPEVSDPWIPYYYEVERQTLFVLMAAEDMEKSIATHPLVMGSSFPHPWESTRFWYSVQSLLVAAGMLSKLLFPPRKSSKERGKRLRGLLRVLEDSPLRVRDLRNVFEHFDEHLDDLSDIPEGQDFLDVFVDPQRLVKDGQKVVYGRAFDSKTWVLSYREQRYGLKTVVQAARDLHERIKKNPDVWWA